MFKYCFVMFAIVCLAPMAWAQSDKSLDIAGVALEMNADEVLAAAEASGYKLRAKGGKLMESSFKEAVEKRLNGQHPSKDPRSAIAMLTFEKTDNPKELISVHFYAMPKGSIVSKIVYLNLSKIYSFDEVFPMVEAKYGEPLRKSRKSAFWADREVSNKNRIPDEAGRLELRVRSTFTLQLSRRSIKAAYDEAFLEAVKGDTGIANPTF